MASQLPALVRKYHSPQEAPTLGGAGGVHPGDLKESINIPCVKHKHSVLLSVAPCIPSCLAQPRPNLSLCPPAAFTADGFHLTLSLSWLPIEIAAGWQREGTFPLL